MKSSLKTNTVRKGLFQLTTLPLGEWNTNCYVLIGAGESIIVDPADAAEFGIGGDFHLHDGDVLTLGDGVLTVVHTPGHTPGSVCLRFGRCAIVGDTLFPGGPGHSDTPEAMAQILASLRDKVFTWPDDTAFYPGHGEGSTIGTVRPAFEAFMARPRSPELCGDVEWINDETSH